MQGVNFIGSRPRTIAERGLPFVNGEVVSPVGEPEGTKNESDNDRGNSRGDAREQEPIHLPSLPTGTDNEAPCENTGEQPEEEKEKRAGHAACLLRFCPRQPRAGFSGNGRVDI